MTWRMMVPLGTRTLSPSADPFFSLQRQVNRVFDDLLGGMPEACAATSMKMDVKEDEKAFHVVAELPGLSEKEVEVTFDDGMLTIRGEKKVERDEKKDTWHIIERSSGSFSRQLSLPTNIDAEKIAARFDKGILTVELPKAPDEKTKAKKIEVKAT